MDGRIPMSNTSIYLLQTFLSGILVLSAIPIISNTLSPDLYGIFILALVYSNLAAGVLNFGLHTGYERNFFLNETSIKKSSSLIYSAISFSALSAAIFIIFLVLFEQNIINLIFQNVQDVPVNFLSLIFLGSVFSTLAQYYVIYLKNSKKAKAQFVYSLFTSGTNLLLIFYFLKIKQYGLISLSYAWVISNILGFIFLFLLMFRRLQFLISLDKLRGMLKISLPVTPKFLFGLLSTQLDKLLIGLIGSESLVGVYHIGQTIALTIFQFMTSLGKVFQPELYRNLFNKTYLSQSLEINNLIAPALYLTIFYSIFLVFFSRELINIFIPAEYYDSFEIVVILSIYYSAIFFGKITGQQLIYSKKTGLVTLMMFLGIVMNVIMNIPLIMIWGIFGAAWATTFAGIFMTIIGFFIGQRFAKIFWDFKTIAYIYLFFFFAVLIAFIDIYFEPKFTISLTIKVLLILSFAYFSYKIKYLYRNIASLFFIK